MVRIQFPKYVSFIFFILYPLACSVEYFIYLPNIIIPQTIFNIPIYFSHPPAIVQFSVLANPDVQIQMFLLTNKFNDIPFQIHDLKENYQKLVDIQIKLYSCNELKACHRNQSTKLLFLKTYQIPVSIKNNLILLSTSRLCYQFNEIVGISVFISNIYEILKIELSENSSLLWNGNGRFQQTVTNYEKYVKNNYLLIIDLFDGKNNLVANWTLNTKEKWSLIEYKIPNNSAVGIWKIVYRIPGKIENNYKEFKVLSNENPVTQSDSKIYINIKFNDDINIDSKIIKFLVCAEYSRIRSIKGEFTGTVCLKNNEEEQFPLRPCLKLSGVFNGQQKCTLVKLRTKELDLKNVTYAQEINRLIIEVEVIDEFSKQKQNFRYVGPVLENSKYKISFLSSLYFKSMLPYYGKIKTVMHNGRPMANASVMIQCNTVNFRYNWGHISKHISDENGLIEFILTSPPKELRVITCDIEDLSLIEETYGTLKYYRPSITQTLERWKSQSPINIQLKILSRTILEGINEELKLELHSNILVNEDLVILLVGNGQVIKSKYIENKELTKVSCQNRDDELGHYTCDPNTGKIKCMKDWKGSNCLIPRCQENCNSGICVDVNFCFCKYGWTGKFCNKCVPTKNCVNGHCVEGNDCVCKTGWIGSNCDVEGVENQYNNKAKLKVKKSIKYERVKPEVQPIFISNFTWIIPLMITPSSLIIHSVSKNPSSLKFDLSPSQVYQIDSFETSDIMFSPSDSFKCIRIHSQHSIEHLIKNLTTIDPLHLPFQANLYNRIVSNQCIMPFQNIDKFQPTLIGQTNLMIDISLIENYDFLNMMKSINLLPISTMKIVSRACPVWKILEEYNKEKDYPRDIIKSKVKSINSINAISQLNFCGCYENCNLQMFNNNKNLYSLNEPHLFSSICTNVSKNNSILLKNQNIKINPSFLVTITTINELRVNEIHYQKITIFNLLHSDLEIEFTIKINDCCLAKPIAKKKFILVKSNQSILFSQNIQFNCSGMFKFLLIFKAKLSSHIYPNLDTKSNNEITQTEKIFYNVVELVYQEKSFSFQFCQNELNSSTVKLNFNELAQSNDYIKLKIYIQNTLENFLNYLKYIYTYEKVESMVALTIRIYEVNLNKLLKSKIYLNQSLIIIKKLIQTESKIPRNISRFLSLEDEIFLINLYADIPQHLYNLKRQFFNFIRQKLLFPRYNVSNCSIYKFKSDEAIMMMSLTSEEMEPPYQIRKKKLEYLKSCLLNLKSPIESYVIEKIIKLYKSNLLEKWIKKEKHSLNLDQLVLSYFILKDKPESQSVITTITKILLTKLNKIPRPIPKNYIFLLLKLFNNFEERFQSNYVPDNVKTKFIKTFSSLSEIGNLDIELPKIYGCSNIDVKASFYIKNSGKESDELDILIKKTNNSCNSTIIELKFKENLYNYHSLLILFPSGWMFDKLHKKSFSKELLKCNILTIFNDRLLSVKLDLYLYSEKCKLKKIILTIKKYQQILNLQPSYIILQTRSNEVFHNKFKVESCPLKSNITKINKTDISSEVNNYNLLRKNIDNFRLIIIKNDYEKFVINSNLIITMTKNNKSESKISIFNLKNEIMEFDINKSLLWFLKNCYNYLCFSGKLISNLIFKYPTKDLKSISYCQSSKSKKFLTTGGFQELICQGIIHPYFIKSIDFSKNKIVLKTFSDVCKINTLFKDEFTMDLLVNKSFLNKCQFLNDNFRKANRNTRNLILISPRNINGRLLIFNVNGEYLINEITDWT